LVNRRGGFEDGFGLFFEHAVVQIGLCLFIKTEF
jgi:hypothetical protein